MTDLNVEGNMAECYCKIMEDAGEAGRCNPCFDSMKADKELFEKRWNDAEEALRKLAGKLYVTDLQVSEANEKGYQRAWKEIREQREGLKARCVEKCSHPADFVCDYEDGTSHCLHCLMDKVWEEEAKAADKPEEGCAHRIVVEVPLPEWKKDHIRAVDEQGREKRKSETCDHDWMKIDPDSAHVIQRKCRKCGLLAV